MNNWTVNAMESLQKAQAKAYEMNHAELAPLHLLWALLSETGLATNTLRSLELDPHLVSQTVTKELENLPTVSQQDIPAPGRELQKVFLEAGKLAGGSGSKAMVGTRELLQALTSDEGRAGSLLKTFNINAKGIAKALHRNGADQAYNGDSEEGVGDDQDSARARH